MKNDSNILLFRNQLSKKFFDIKDYVIFPQNLNKIQHADGYSDLFQSGKIPLEVIDYLFYKAQDFRYILSEIYKGLQFYRQQGIPSYSEIALNYLRQMNPNPYSDEIVCFDTLSRVADKHNSSREKAKDKLEKLFQLHLVGFFGEIYMKNAKSNNLMLTAFDVSILMSATILHNIPSNKVSEMLLQTAYNKRNSEIIQGLIGTNLLKSDDLRRISLEYSSLVLLHKKGQLDTNEVNRLRFLFLQKIMVSVFAKYNEFRNKKEESNMLLFDIGNKDEYVAN